MRKSVLIIALATLPVLARSQEKPIMGASADSISVPTDSILLHRSKKSFITPNDDKVSPINTLSGVGASANSIPVPTDSILLHRSKKSITPDNDKVPPVNTLSGVGIPADPILFNSTRRSFITPNDDKVSPINTLSGNFGTNETILISGYGAPILKITYFASNWGVLAGGKGGVIINRSFAAGGIGYGAIDRNLFEGTLFNPDTKRIDVSFGAGGIFLEYIFNQEDIFHISIPFNICFGKFITSRDHDIINKSNGFILEPGINFELNVFDFFVSAFNISYRQVFGSSLEGYNNLDLSGINFGLVLKFGLF